MGLQTTGNNKRKIINPFNNKPTLKKTKIMALLGKKSNEFCIRYGAAIVIVELF
jgi:hypothetical protein